MAGWLTACGAEANADASGLESSEALTDTAGSEAAASSGVLPPRVGLSLSTVRNAAEKPSCLYEQYFTDKLMQSYYLYDAPDSYPPLPVCVTAWLNDSGGGFGPSGTGYSDIFVINVKRARPTNDLTYNWTRLGEELGYVRFNGGNPSEVFYIALDVDGNPVVAFLQGEGIRTSPLLKVVRWDGTQWVQLGDYLNRLVVDGPGYTANNPRLRWNAQGQLVVAWTKRGGGAEPNVIITKTWNGSAWQ
ncbi:MAG TPA: hypothetical protein VEY30_01905 [Myxococcaceae bacterium]|nr:hypothetical protein [Myxococcaceae bacterium]